ncbi:hypothetical protein ALI144C_52770 [Actinosynnema sp. ALI-1.44]|uniref:hypothetical protein n=1 Tax=Actinosynnema sp. ALI-1.44 TaxID=1933779 RepID=UPI00097BFBDD|nr:hypothetical protein [Actinosynnema sp. ALI-1.44]ONI71196.1 hypothetical protein ALI144C_52770 [Actinosynnema sp. ALI-1.44]
MWTFWEYQQAEHGVLVRWVQDFEMKPQSPVDDAAMLQGIRPSCACRPRKPSVERATSRVAN